MQNPKRPKRFFSNEDIDKALSIKPQTTAVKIEIGNHKSTQKIPKCCDGKEIKYRHVEFGFYKIICAQCSKLLKIFRILPSKEQKFGFLDYSKIDADTLKPLKCYKTPFAFLYDTDKEN